MTPAPAPTPRARLAPADYVALAVTGAALAALVLLATLWVPSMTRLFRDFGGALPGLTRLVVSSLWAPAWGLLLGGAAAAGALVPLRQSARTAVLVTVATLAVLAAASVVAGVYLPLFQLADAVRAD
jgi:type II secretory pathway component PulF